MRWSLILLLCANASAQGIRSTVITPNEPTKIVLSQSSVTVVRFPFQFTGVYALGLVLKKDDQGVVQGSYSQNKPELILHALAQNVDTMMVVSMNEQLYTFRLVTGRDPDIAVTLTSGSSVGALQAIKPDMVVQTRPKYDSELLVDLMDRARGVGVLKASYPEGYRGYEHRSCRYVSDDGSVQTVVTDIHKFGLEDAIVLTGQITNESDQPLKFDSGHIGISVGNVIYPITLLSCPRPIPPHQTTEIAAEMVGDMDGGRARIGVTNEFRLVVNTDHSKKQETKP